MLYSFTNRRDENKKLYELTYNIYDKYGNIIEITSNQETVILTSQYDNTIPEYTVDQFFKNVALGSIRTGETLLCGFVYHLFR